MCWVTYNIFETYLTHSLILNGIQDLRIYSRAGYLTNSLILSLSWSDLMSLASCLTGCLTASLAASPAVWLAGLQTKRWSHRWWGRTGVAVDTKYNCSRLRLTVSSCGLISLLSMRSLCVLSCFLWECLVCFLAFYENASCVQWPASSPRTAISMIGVACIARPRDERVDVHDQLRCAQGCQSCIRGLVTLDLQFQIIFIL